MVKRELESQDERSKKEMKKNRIISEVEQLAAGQSLIYKLPEFYWSGFGAFLIAELNPTHPEKGKKYILSSDKIADGKPAGAKNRARDTDKPKDYADWVLQFNGERFG